MAAQTTTKIANAREYQITLNAIRDLERGIAEQESFRSRRDPAEHWLVVSGMEGMLADLCQQAAEYQPGDERSYQATAAAIHRYEDYARHREEASERLDPDLLGLLRENTRSFLEDLRTQAAAYEAAQRRNT